MRRFMIALATVAGFVGPASAATISALNNASVVGIAPAVVADSQFGNNDGITVGFNEASNVILTTDMVLGGRSFKAGTTFDSHLLYHDRFSGSDYITSMNGFRFSKTIAAVIAFTDELNATHSIFGMAQTTYKSAYGFFGLESDERSEIRVTNNEIYARFTVNQGFDAVRVLTIATVPLPASGLLILAGFAALGAVGRQRNS